MDAVVIGDCEAREEEMDEEEREEETREASVIVVTFAEPGSAELGVKWEGVTPTQLLTAGEYLRMIAEKRINERWMKEAMAQMQQKQAMAQVQQMLCGERVQ